MAEDEALITALDSLETHKGPQRFTCQWWTAASPQLREAVIRNSHSKTHTAVTRELRARGQRVTAPGIKEHVTGSCKSCQTS